jgi:hypothetical protein
MNRDRNLSDEHTFRFARHSGVTVTSHKLTSAPEQFPDCSLNAGVLLGALRQNCEHVD